MDFKREKDHTYVFALGGLQEIGKNTYVFECNDEIIIVDAGMKLSNDISKGIEAIIPDYKYLEENKHKIKGLLITHGHEDHIGGIPHLLTSIDIPVIWAPKIAAALIENKMKDKLSGKKYNLEVYERDSVWKSKEFTVSVFEVNHSIPDSFGFWIKTKNSSIISTGDFKFDFNPLGNDAEIPKIVEASNAGVDLLMSDSTGALSPGWTASESVVAKTVDGIFRNSQGRIIIATFSSNIYRVKEIIELAIKYNKKIMIFGRSMVKGIETARSIGFIKAPDNIFVGKNDGDKFNDNELLIITTGSQGETLAALSRIANQQHPQINIKKNDTVVFSSSPIPGNRASIAYVINLLYKQGANVLDNSIIRGLHTSGHGYVEEQRLMLKLVKPVNFMPMHGEYAMLAAHKDTAVQTGIDPNRVFILGNGDVLDIHHGLVPQVVGKVPASDIYAEGLGVASANEEAWDQRDTLSEEGVIAIYLPFKNDGITPFKFPAILTRGSFYADDEKTLIYKIRNTIKKILQDKLKKPSDLIIAVKKIEEVVQTMVFNELKKKPLIEILVIKEDKDVANKYLEKFELETNKGD